VFVFFILGGRKRRIESEKETME